ncbi:MAG TPA: hypothetical protein VFF14_01540 [Candidatus Deferrimicrobium sp.]|nr:hypothetical protein [Candidatus Deferrimicrobium sp.]
MFYWLTLLLAIISFLLFPSTNAIFMAVTKVHPYLLGFVKFAILATMGELLALRIISGVWKKPVGLVYRAIIWGFLGMTFVLVFDLFARGVAGSVNAGLLPSFAGKLGPAFFTSALMNLIFGPTFMAFHRITDTYIDLGEGNLGKICKIKLADVVNKIDWHGFISFVVLKTVPFFWIPAHTITFMLPPEYRVLAAAFLSIALGGILAFAKKQSTTLN